MKETGKESLEIFGFDDKINNDKLKLIDFLNNVNCIREIKF